MIALDQEILNGAADGIDGLVITNLERLLRDLIREIQHPLLLSLGERRNKRHGFERKMALIGHLKSV